MRRGGELVAFAALLPPGTGPGDPRLGGLRLATLSDLLVAGDHPAAGRAALARAEELARGLGADGILATASHPAALALLRRAAYLPAPGNVHLLVRPPKDLTFPEDLGQWWITRADGDSEGDL